MNTKVKGKFFPPQIQPKPKAPALVDQLMALKEQLLKEQDFEAAAKVRDVERIVRLRNSNDCLTTR